MAMQARLSEIEAPLSRLQQMLTSVPVSGSMKPAVERWRSDAAALQFHLGPRDAGKPLLIAVIGGTGTGKSTVVNRLLGVDASATSFRRTFTAGPVAIVRDAKKDIPTDWLGVDHIIVAPENLPARGHNGTLVIVPSAALGEQQPQSQSLLDHVVLIDTPDLDGDQPVHHAEADRTFRWAEALVFLVTPEKYQMTELLPYYRLASRYEIPALFVMNKCEEQVVIEDYREQLPAMGITARPVHLFSVARDDAAYSPAAGEDLTALRESISTLSAQEASRDNSTGLSNRVGDLVGRFEDQIYAPLRQERREAMSLITALHDMETAAPGVDVNPVTQDLERRLQQRSVLYLIGPQRVLDRVRQAPGMLVRLPRAAWDYVMRGEMSRGLLPSNGMGPREVPDFKMILSDQFSVVQSRIDDLLRTSPAAQKWIAAGGKAYSDARIAPEIAGNIADEELAELKAWLEKRWNATPRDTRALQSLLKYLPGGNKLTAVAESAPYLLVIALIAHHALFGTDLLVLGGYTIATWLTERLSNEVAARTRAANMRIADRFTRLAHDQIQKMCTWIDQQAVPTKMLERLDRAADDLATASGMTNEIERV